MIVVALRVDRIRTTHDVSTFFHSNIWEFLYLSFLGYCSPDYLPRFLDICICTVCLNSSIVQFFYVKIYCSGLDGLPSYLDSPSESLDYQFEYLDNLFNYLACLPDYPNCIFDYPYCLSAN